MELKDGMAGLVAAMTAPRKPNLREAECQVKEIGALWAAQIDFVLDGEIVDEAAVDVRKVLFNGIEVDYETLSCAAQEEITWACLESVK